MADLDDFFAKRDKKKSKSKKFDTADDLAKILDAKTKEKKKLETGKSNYTQEGGRQSPGPGLPAGDDDEWIEAEEKKPDYTGLKIQELVLSDEDDADTKSQDGRASGDEGGKEGPWNKKTKEAKPKDKDDEVPQEQEEAGDGDEKKENEDKPEDDADEAEGEGSKDSEKEGSDSGPKKYVPPSKRNQPDGAAPASAAAPAPAPSSGASYVPPSRRPGGAASSTPLAPMKKKVGAPTLADEESFPSLS